MSSSTRLTALIAERKKNAVETTEREQKSVRMAITVISLFVISGLKQYNNLRQHKAKYSVCTI